MFARASPLTEGRLVFRSRKNNGESTALDIPMELTALREQAEEGGFFSYVCGVAAQILQSYDVGGIEIDNYRTTLADGKVRPMLCFPCLPVPSVYCGSEGD